MKIPIRTGIIACGPRAVQMAQIVRLLPKIFKLVAMSDPDLKKLNEMKKRFPDIDEFYESSENLLEKSGIEAVIVETPPEQHSRYVVMALKRGIHVMGEIPAVNTYEEAQILWNIVNTHPDVIYMCGATANYRQKTRLLSYLSQRGLVGKMVYAEAEYTHGMEKPYIENSNQEFVWRMNYDACRYCTHSLGPLLEIIDDDEFVSVSCMGTGKHFPSAWKDHAMVSILRTRKNVVVRFLAAFGLYKMGPYHTTRIFTDRGMIELYNEKARIFNPDFASFCEMPEMIELPFGRFPRRFTEDFPVDKIMEAGGGGHGGADFIMLEDFADAIINGKESPISIKKGLAMTLPGIFAAESAARGGELVQIKYPWS